MSTVLGRSTPLDRVRALYLKLSDVTQSIPDRLPGMGIQQVEEYRQLFQQYCSTLTQTREYLSESASRLGLSGLVPGAESSLDQLEEFSSNLEKLEVRMESMQALKQVVNRRTGEQESSISTLIDSRHAQILDRWSKGTQPAAQDVQFEHAAEALMTWIEKGSQLSDQQMIAESDLIEAQFGRKVMLMAATGRLERVKSEEDLTYDNAIFGD